MVAEMKELHNIDIIDFCVKKAGLEEMQISPSDVVSTVWSFYGGKMFPDIGGFWNASHAPKLDELEAMFPHPVCDARVSQALCRVMSLGWRQYRDLYFHHFPVDDESGVGAH